MPYKQLQRLLEKRSLGAGRDHARIENKCLYAFSPVFMAAVSQPSTNEGITRTYCTGHHVNDCCAK